MSNSNPEKLEIKKRKSRIFGSDRDKPKNQSFYQPKVSDFLATTATSDPINPEKLRKVTESMFRS